LGPNRNQTGGLLIYVITVLYTFCTFFVNEFFDDFYIFNELFNDLYNMMSYLMSYIISLMIYYEEILNYLINNYDELFN